ncbi:hypothetical protein ACIBCD_27085 [Nocardia brasiliensis]|uniref:hypothetical protein n=1 Tax=Nocardia brasiliensis TaxID=37326 RepID=UPI0037A085CD
MSEHLHFVAITGEADRPKIEFTCRGDRTAECHSYPDCECASWDTDHEEQYGHPAVAHDQCWMQEWFQNEDTHPYWETLPDFDYRPGMSGPVTASFDSECVEWEFVADPAVPT